MPHTTTHPGICRICSAHCGVLATVTDGRLTKVAGDPDNPMFQGYTCAKGRALPEIHNNPQRLLHSRRRHTDGTYTQIGSTLMPLPTASITGRYAVCTAPWVSNAHSSHSNSSPPRHG